MTFAHFLVNILHITSSSLHIVHSFINLKIYIYDYLLLQYLLGINLVLIVENKVSDHK